MEYIEILLRDVNSVDIDTILNQELEVSNDLIISSHFYDNVKDIDMEYEDIDSLNNYFSIANTGNIYVKELVVGEKFLNVMIVMSFDTKLGDLVLNFSEDNIVNSDRIKTKAIMTSMIGKLIKIQQQYRLKEIRVGYEPIIDIESSVLSISDGKLNVSNNYNGIIMDITEEIYKELYQL